jgi:hypothetical protein
MILGELRRPAVEPVRADARHSERGHDALAVTQHYQTQISRCYLRLKSCRSSVRRRFAAKDATLAVVMMELCATYARAHAHINFRRR